MKAKRISRDELNTGGLLKEEVIRCYPELEIKDSLADLRSMLRWLDENVGIDYSQAWADGGFDYIATEQTGGKITAVFGFFENREQTVNLIPIYTFCPACNCPDYTMDLETGLKVCDACDALFGELESNRSLPFDMDGMTENHSHIRYFDIRIPVRQGLPSRVHGWMDRTSKAVYQWG